MVHRICKSTISMNNRDVTNALVVAKVWTLPDDGIDNAQSAAKVARACFVAGTERSSRFFETRTPRRISPSCASVCDRRIRLRELTAGFPPVKREDRRTEGGSSPPRRNSERHFAHGARRSAGAGNRRRNEIAGEQTLA